MLINALTKSRIDLYLNNPGQAMALIGPQGAGKGHIANYIAQTLLDTASSEHPYIRHINADTQKIGIGEIREVQKFLTLTVPGASNIKRVLILESIDTLGHEAQNALLKTLEEPPKDTVIIVTYTNDESVLRTIRSRVHQISVLPVALDNALEELSSIDSELVTKSYHISQGYTGLLWVLCHGTEPHPLRLAIEEARGLLQQSRYQRLASIDRITKHKEIPTATLLDGLYRILSASYHQAVQSKSNDELKPLAHRMKVTANALNDLDAHVQAKLVLSRLFIDL